MAKNKQDNFPETIRAHLEQIAVRLWSDRAVVMVGAGFSKNASAKYPSWFELGDILFEKAHGRRPDTNEKSYLSLLKVAEDAEAVIKRPALDAVLMQHIPDNTVDPSVLHETLLELPWADVLTTNYDTLLERAQRKVISRRYSTVFHQDDLSYQKKPRIIKLHGSFPSHRPFVITEEDYRQYPQKRAPFVNTVRQALLENTLCLIGFSGDDPNFLHWIGWIRDQLGSEQCQPIYLIATGKISVAQQAVLAKRQIIVVDMTLCNGFAVGDHAAAIERFFNFMKGRNPYSLDWPKPDYTRPENFLVKESDFTSRIAAWSSQRLAYPGWRVLPQSKRENLLSCTRSWAKVDFTEDAKSTKSGNDLLFLFELVWRLDRCLLPLFDDITQKVEAVLKKYWPFPSTLYPTDYEVTQELPEFQYLDWPAIRVAWLELACALLRFYREDDQQDNWQILHTSLDSLRNYLSDEQREFLQYQSYLFQFFQLNFSGAREQLALWQPALSKPYWQSIRFCAAAELGLLYQLTMQDKSFELGDGLLQALFDTKEQAKNTIAGVSYQSESDEAYQMVHCRWIPEALLGWRERSDRNEQTELNEKHRNQRWDELKAVCCDPWAELKLFELMLGKPVDIQQQVVEKDAFDLGRKNTSSNFGTDDLDALNAYAFLRFAEDIGLPCRVSNTTFVKNTFIATLPRIAKYSSTWALITMLRSGEPKVVDELFNRESVFRLTVEYCDQLILRFIKILKSYQPSSSDHTLEKKTFEQNLALILPEVISRLCCKCSAASKSEILSLIDFIYQSSHKANYGGVKNLSKRLLDSLTDTELSQFLPDILKIKPPRDLNLRTKNEFPALFQILGLTRRQGIPTTDLTEIQPEIDYLLRDVASDDSSLRDWTVSTLLFLLEIGALSENQIEQFAEACWKQADPFGLPKCELFYKFVFLKYLPSTVEQERLYRTYLSSLVFPIQKSGETSVTLTNGRSVAIDELLGSVQLTSVERKGKPFWTIKEANKLLKQLSNWWDSDKHRLESERNSKPRESSIFGGDKEFHSRLQRISAVLAIVIGPTLNNRASSTTKKDLLRLLDEMRDQKLNTLEAQASCCHVVDIDSAFLLAQITDAIQSADYEKVVDALMAILLIIQKDLKGLQSEAVLLLCQILLWDRSKTLIQSLWVVIWLVREMKEKLPPKLQFAALKLIERLKDESSYDSERLNLTFNEKIELREAVVTLASEFAVHLPNLEIKSTSVIDYWRQISGTTNEFAEVRAAWRSV
ncbi:SIR2 family protein [Shewanella bicestrii]|uniref:SIR2 family NAD-dependent protein deacylase n=1 Tax=Shewanella sp. GD03713 TaxID=2975372 RepID=UPI0024477A06|nr:SIR2 family protein [Shewanella sp. GD03713]MDH1471558.1 SIR2 family protein [Shewanella sp. GD03713]